MRNNLLLSITKLREGRHRIVCPKCNGGVSKERSLSVLVGDGWCAWNCWRASCGFKGRHGDRGWRVVKKEQKAREVHKKGYVTHTVKDNAFSTRGFLYRAEQKGVTPKVLLDIDSDWCCLHFPRIVWENYVLLVEDVKSAERMADYFPTVALLGTHLTLSKIDYLCKQGISYGIIALDADATAKALKLYQSHSFVQRVLLLDKDLKDETFEGINKHLKQLYEMVLEIEETES